MNIIRKMATNTHKPNNNNSLTITLLKNLDVGKIRLTPVGDNTDPKYKSDAQKLSFPDMHDNNGKKCKILLQFPLIKLSGGGVPKITEKNAKHYDGKPEKRSFCRVPLDPTDPNCVIIEKKIQELDDFFTKNAELILGKGYKNYKYSPILKLPDFDDEDPPKREDGTPYPKHNLLKIKFDVDYNRKHVITTSINLKDCDTGNELLDEKGKPIEADSIDVAERYIRPGCQLRMMINISKIWAQKKATQPGEPKRWGVTLKPLLFEVITRPANISVKEAIKQKAFGFQNDDDDVNTKSLNSKNDEEHENPEPKQETKTLDKQGNKSESESDESGESSEEESEEEQKPPPKNVTKAKTTAKK